MNRGDWGSYDFPCTRLAKLAASSFLATHPDAKANTIVQLFCLSESGVMLLSHPMFVGSTGKKKENPMNSDESFDNSTCADQISLAERELSAFIRAVTELFGPEQAKLSTQDWLDESELTDSPPRPTSRDWRAVTVAASARLVKRLTVAQQRTQLVTPADTQISPILSSNCVFSTGLV